MQLRGIGRHHGMAVRQGRGRDLDVVLADRRSGAAEVNVELGEDVGLALAEGNDPRELPDSSEVDTTRCCPGSGIREQRSDRQLGDFDCGNEEWARDGVQRVVFTGEKSAFEINQHRRVD